jgi:tRNA(Ile)-lysidine synthase
VGAAQFEQRVAERWPIAGKPQELLILAVSGGSDSVAMLRAMHHLRKGDGENLIVGHVHHHLRGEAADRDAQFVRDLCQQLAVTCHVGHVDGSSCGDGIEAAARNARYQWLTDLTTSLSAPFIATAHTADDQVETILHRMVRGTGLGGLSGIPNTRHLAPGVTLVRPLLGCTRSEIERYLADVGQQACEDETNRDTDLTRNRIRHELLPLIEEQYNPQVRDALLRLGTLAGEAQSLVDARVAEIVQSSCIITGDSRVILKPAALTAVEPFLVRELLIHVWKMQRWPLQAMGYDQWQRLVDMIADQAASTQMFPGPIRAEKQGEQLVLTRPVGD